MTNDNPTLITIPQLAERLTTSERHVRRLIAERRIPFIKVGRLIRFDPADVERWISEHRTDEGTRAGRAG